MAEPTLPDPEQVLASIMEQQKQAMAAGRQATLDALQVYEQMLTAVADSQEKLAEASEAEWLRQIFRANASLTRQLIDASSKFARDVMEP